MYCQFYNLKERPFNVTSDPDFFFFSRKHEEALAHLTYGIAQRKGIITITGEIGTGKTTLCRFFLNTLPKGVKTAFILNPYLSDIQLLESIVTDFGVNVKGKNRFNFVAELNKFLLRESEQGNNVVLIVDEAQNLKAQQLEQIRLLSNLETEKHKLLQIVLVGQPELNQRLNLHELRQLQQRIMVRCHISCLDKDEVSRYIEHRLNVAGSPQGKIKFSSDAFEEIYDFSAGTPRLINILCDRALLAGFVGNTHSIDLNTVRKCTEELGVYFSGEAK